MNVMEKRRNRWDVPRFLDHFSWFGVPWFCIMVFLGLFLLGSSTKWMVLDGITLEKRWWIKWLVRTSGVFELQCKGKHQENEGVLFHRWKQACRGVLVQEDHRSLCSFRKQGLAGWLTAGGLISFVLKMNCDDARWCSGHLNSPNRNMLWLTAGRFESAVEWFRPVLHGFKYLEDNGSNQIRSRI